jgi:ABC-type sugar transport system ATPase subunit
MTFLTVSGIRKGDENFTVLRGISFSQQRFRKVAVAGETGSGKSTLLKIIAGLVQPDAGEVLFEHERVKGPDEKLVPGYPGISYLSQHFELPKFLRVEQILSYANSLSTEDADKVYEVCRIIHLLDRKTDQLSGGEKQRIALAKLLITSPKLLMLDEPFSNLDMIHKNILKAVIADIFERLRITCILVSHDPVDTLSWADELLVMRGGEILQQGSPENIYKEPVNEYVAGLFGKFTLVGEKELPIFPKLLLRDLRGKKIIVRPEQLRISLDREQGTEGTVTKISFLGSQYEAEVLVGEQTFIIRTELRNIKKGQPVYVSFRENEVFGMI